MNEPILIVGGGIGGLVAAIALHRQGRSVVVYEQAPAITAVGAGISLGSTASMGLYSLGLRDALIAASDHPTHSAALHYESGAVLGGGFADREWDAKVLGDTNMIHRADLMDVLTRAVQAHDPDCIRLGHRFLGYEQDDDGVTAHFADGVSARGPVLIGCDGVRSAVRTQMVGEVAPRFTGHVAYRFLVPMERAAPFMGAGPSSTYVGPGRSLLRYVISKGRMVNCVAFVTTDAWTGEGWSTRATIEEMLDLFAGWHPDVTGLVRNADPATTGKWALFDRDPLDRWVDGRVALLGDAAHPMLPFLGLGAAMGIEDGVVLGRAFGADVGDAAALTIYQAARAQRAGLMLLESRRQCDMFREGPGAAARVLTSHAERMNYDPATVPLPAFARGDL